MNHPKPDPSPLQGASSTPSLHATIEGMHCASCVARVETALKSVPGVASAVVNLASSEAEIQYDPSQANVDQMAGALKKVGYTLKASAPDTPSSEAPSAE